MGWFVRVPTTEYCIVLDVSLGLQGVDPILFVPPMHLTISLVPVRTDPVRLTPEGTRMLVLLARVISKPLSVWEESTKMANLTWVFEPALGPVTIASETGQLVAFAFAMQTLPAVDALGVTLNMTETLCMRVPLAAATVTA